jgi:hypothetical protein
MTAEQMSTFLNGMNKLDPQCVADLFLKRANCNQAIADHPLIQVRAETPMSQPTVGLLGILNAMLLEQGSKDVVAMMVDGDVTKVIGFGVRNYQEMCVSAP